MRWAVILGLLLGLPFGGCTFDRSGIPVRVDGPVPDQPQLSVPDGPDSSVPDAPVADQPHTPDGPGLPDTAPIVPDMSPGSKLVYSTTFSGGSDLVGDGMGWVEEEGMYKQKSCTGMPDAWLVGKKSMANARVRATFTVNYDCDNSPTQVGVMLRAQGISGCNNDYFGCVVNLDSNHLQMGKVNAACSFAGWSNHLIPGFLNYTALYTIELENNGNDFTCTFWGGWVIWPTVAKWSAPAGTPMVMGAPGLITNKAQVRFHDFKVWSL